MKIKVTKELLEKCIKDVDIEEQGENCKLILRFTDDTTDEEAEAISDYFENIYKYVAMMFGISEDELDNICKMADNLNIFDNTKDDYNIDSIINNLLGMQNSNIDSKLKNLDNINEPSKEELDRIEKEKENKIIDMSKYRKR